MWYWSSHITSWMWLHDQTSSKLKWSSSRILFQDTINSTAHDLFLTQTISGIIIQLQFINSSCYNTHVLHGTTLGCKPQWIPPQHVQMSSTYYPASKQSLPQMTACWPAWHSRRLTFLFDVSLITVWLYNEVTEYLTTSVCPENRNWGYFQVDHELILIDSPETSSRPLPCIWD